MSDLLVLVDECIPGTDAVGLVPRVWPKRVQEQGGLADDGHLDDAVEVRIRVVPLLNALFVDDSLSKPFVD